LQFGRHRLRRAVAHHALRGHADRPVHPPFALPCWQIHFLQQDLGQDAPFDLALDPLQRELLRCVGGVGRVAQLEARAFDAGDARHAREDLAGQRQRLQVAELHGLVGAALGRGDRDLVAQGGGEAVDGAFAERAHFGVFGGLGIDETSGHGGAFGGKGGAGGRGGEEEGAEATFHGRDAQGVVSGLAKRSLAHSRVVGNG
jgi:hypothetical protein